MISIVVQFLLLALASSDSSSLDDIDLARRIKNGNHDAFRNFFDAHHETLYRYLSARGTSGPVAEDLVQKAFITIWEKRAGIDETKSLRAYLFKIAYTRMLDHIRDHAKFVDAETGGYEVNTITPADDAQHQELTEAIESAIEAMPEKRGMVFESCFMQGFTYKETADSLGISHKTVENHMGLALKDIRSALKDFRVE